MSVDYGLAPEDPFPLGITDALSVIDYLLNDDDDDDNDKDSSSRCRRRRRKSIHLTGMSAGANICLVAGFEAVRRFPGKIASIQAQSPMVNPAGDSLSYYTNRAVTPKVSWLRWCWQAYLGLEQRQQQSPPPPQNNNSKNESPPAKEYSGDNEESSPSSSLSELEKALLRKDSNYSSWNTWKLRHPSEALHRLVNPALGLPENGIINNNGDNRLPKIIVRYNTGDPLHGDGKLVVEALLKQKTGGGGYGKNTHFYEESGLHCNLFGPYNPNNPQEYWKVWADAVFRGTGRDDDSEH